MAGLPITIPLPAESAIASYDFTDMIDNSGGVSFNLTAKTDSVGKTYLLTTRTLRPQRDYFTAEYTRGLATDCTGIRAQTSSDVFTKVLDLDFDTLEFKTSQIIKGTMYFNIASSLMVMSSDRAAEAYIVAKVYSVDGVTETLINTSQSGTLANSIGYLIRQYFLWTTEITATNIGVGKKIRVTLEVYLRRSAGAAENVAILIGFDPLDLVIPPLGDGSGAAGTTALGRLTLPAGETKSTINIPFKLDL